MAFSLSESGAGEENRAHYGNADRSRGAEGGRRREEGKDGELERKVRINKCNTFHITEARALPRAKTAVSRSDSAASNTIILLTLWRPDLRAP